MQPAELNVTIDIPAQQLIEALTGAWEGGIDGWGNSYNARAERNEQRWVTRLIFDTPGGDTGANQDFIMTTTAIGPEELAGAIARVLNEPPLQPQLKAALLERLKNDAESIEIDSAEANLLVQIAGFGRVVYP